MPLERPDGQMILPCGPEAVPVRVLVKAGNGRASPISVTFGLHGSGSLKSAVLSQSLGNKLRDNLASRGSTLFRLTWKERVTPSGRRIYALRASVLRMRGRGSIGWQTPTPRDGKGESGKGNRIKRGKNGRLHVANLCDQIVDLGRRDLLRSTLFRCALMGLPIEWEQCAAMATLLLRRSRKSSSKRT